MPGFLSCLQETQEPIYMMKALGESHDVVRIAGYGCRALQVHAYVKAGKKQVLEVHRRGITVLPGVVGQLRTRQP